MAVPAIPMSSCPSAAAAIGAGGLGPVCQAASGVSGLAGSAVSQLAGAGVDSVLNGLGTWVSDGASWLLGQIGAVIGATTGVDLGASWFGAHYETMAALGATVVVPLLLLGVMQAVYRQNLSMLLRSALVHVPLAILLTAVAVKLVQLGLAVTDAMSAAVSQGAGLDAGHFLGSVTSALSGPAAVGSSGVPTFVLFLGALAVVFGAVMVWIELLLRAAAVYVAVLFLPLALASLAWPAIAHWCRRLVDTLVALVLGKFVIVSVLSLSAGALAGGTGSAPSGAGAGAGPGTATGGGFGAVLGGAALLLLAALSPWALFRLLPFVETGAVSHLEAVGRRAHQAMATPVRGLAQVAMRASVAGGAAGVAGGVPAGVGAGLGGAVAGEGGGLAGVGRRTPGSRRARGAGPPFPTDPSPDRPDPGPSSVETSGVGTTEPPGHAIPTWDVHPAATAAARYYLDGPGAGVPPTGDPLPPSLGPSDAPLGSAVGAPADPHGPTGVTPLPRQSGALVGYGLGRDELGPRLIATRPAPPPSGAPPAGRG